MPSWAGNPAVFEQDRSDKPPSFSNIHFSLAQGRRVRKDQLRTLMSVDDMVGRIFDTLHRLGELRNTLAFYLSDNGYLWADHHLGGDTQNSRSEAPPVHAVGAGAVLRALAPALPGRDQRPSPDGTVDIAPTVLEAAGISPDPTEPPLDGRSLLEPDTRNRILLEYWQGHAAPWIQTWASVRTPQYQYIEYYGDDEATKTFGEYYDLVSDPWQLQNLLADGDPSNDPNVDYALRPARRRPFLCGSRARA